MTYYTKKHEWVKIINQKAVVGVSEYAASELGDVTFVELPSVSDSVEGGEYLCTIESVKAAAEVYAPIGGTIAAVNKKLEDDPQILNDSAEEAGWICKLDDYSEADLMELMDGKEYKEYLKTL
ncbi:MAG: glycine cleavage system protein GcvH [Lentisphaeria bacterium]